MLKCNYCHKSIDESEAVFVNDKYVFCKEHQNASNYRKKIFNLLAEITNTKEYALWTKNFSGLINKYSPRTVIYYLQDNKQSLERTIKSKTFTGSYGMVRYLVKILENNLNGYKVKENEVAKNIENSDDIKTVIPKRQKKKSLNELLNGVLNE